MEIEQARALIEEYVRAEFGRVVQLRDVSVVRTSTGRVWNGILHCITAMGEVEVGSVGVTEQGEITGGFGVDRLVEALWRIKPLSVAPGAPAPAVADPDQTGDFERFTLGGISPEDGFDEPPRESFFVGLDSAGHWLRIEGLLASDAEEDLLKARHLLPRLLANPDERGDVLRRMGEVEIRLGQPRLALDYLEASAREFADRALSGELAKVADMTRQIVGEEAFDQHPVAVLVQQTRERLQPVKRLEEVPAFAGLGDEEMFELQGAAEQVTVNEGITLLKEGSPSANVFVVKSGVLSVHLEAPDGGTRVVRCCFPGELVGESCVLGEPGTTCNATVTTLTSASLWCFDGTRLRQLAEELPVLKARIESTRELHRLDSFFSMNRATSTLDVHVRDRLLGCISAVCYAEPGDALGRTGEMPQAVYLVAEGSVEYRVPGLAPRAIGPDSFVGLRDALHQLPFEGDFVAVAPCRLFCFDVSAIRELASEATPEVLAVFERIG